MGLRTLPFPVNNTKRAVGDIDAPWFSASAANCKPGTVVLRSALRCIRGGRQSRRLTLAAARVRLVLGAPILVQGPCDWIFDEAVLKRPVSMIQYQCVRCPAPDAMCDL
jgi:hypothetical protein